MHAFCIDASVPCIIVLLAQSAPFFSQKYFCSLVDSKLKMMVLHLLLGSKLLNTLSFCLCETFPFVSSCGHYFASACFTSIPFAKNVLNYGPD